MKTFIRTWALVALPAMVIASVLFCAPRYHRYFDIPSPRTTPPTCDFAEQVMGDEWLDSRECPANKTCFFSWGIPFGK